MNYLFKYLKIKNYDKVSKMQKYYLLMLFINKNIFNSIIIKLSIIINLLLKIYHYC